MALGLKLKYLKTRMTVKFQLQLSLDAYQIYIWVEDLRTFSQLKITDTRKLKFIAINGCFEFNIYMVST